jgi:uncharacterized protein (TIGR03437 family)
MAIPSHAQQPVITPGSVVSAASYTQPVAPGSIVSIFGTNLATAVYTAAGTPLPMTLGGTSVSMNGVPAPLFYVSPTLIQAQAPSSLALTNVAYTTANVVVKSGSGASGPVSVSLYQDAPALFTADESGCGPAAALNLAPDGGWSLNSPSNSAAPGDFVVLFGTGFGIPYPTPPDGSRATAALHFPGAGFMIDGVEAPAQYVGVAPGVVGADQV